MENKRGRRTARAGFSYSRFRSAGGGEEVADASDRKAEGIVAEASQFPAGFCFTAKKLFGGEFFLGGYIDFMLQHEEEAEEGGHALGWGIKELTTELPCFLFVSANTA